MKWGYWIKGNARQKSPVWKCAACGVKVMDLTVGLRRVPAREQYCTYKYCPHCGAQMRDYEEVQDETA